jgi:predicted transcriptional regulator
MVVIHGPKGQDDVDKLAIELAELDYIPLVLSLKPNVEELIDSMKRLKIVK